MARLSKADRIPIILDFLDRRYPETPIPLDHQDAFTLLVAVLLSAQCTDERVNQVTPRLFGLADNPADMARQSVDDIQAIIRPCGLAPAKAKNIQALSQQLVEQYAGAVPDCLEALEALPGVGHKTAQVVLAQAFGQPAFPVDTHIHRLAQRWGLTAGKNVAQTEKDLKRAFPVDRWNKLHLQIIYFGRECCTARTVCDGSDAACPLCPVLNGWRKRPFQAKKA